MAKYLKISNQTEIELNAFMLIGACTKRNDNNKIGYFGSGLKYAMAVLLRNGIEFEIYSGLNKIDIGLIKENFRGQSFDVITINNQKTNLTTEMGIKWKLWQALREIYCNAVDENECNLEQVDEVVPKENETAFYISMSNEQIDAIITNWDKYFTNNRKPILICETGKVYNSYEDTISLYRKGIRCYENNIKGLYDYDFNHIDINESRLIEYSFYIGYKLGTIWGHCATESMIDRFIHICSNGLEIEQYKEYDIDWSHASHFNNAWINKLKDYILIPFEYAGHYNDIRKKEKAIVLPDSLIKRLIQLNGDIIKTAYKKSLSNEYIVKKPSKSEEYLLNECMKFFGEVGLAINHEIEIAIFKEKHVLGTAYKNTIILSERVMTLGKKQIVTTIMEECFHLESQAGDETREFQDYLINQMITMLENKHGIFL